MGLFPVSWSSRIHLPASLCSTGVTPLQRYYECSDFLPALYFRQELPASRTLPSDRSASKHPTSLHDRFSSACPQRRGLPAPAPRRNAGGLQSDSGLRLYSAGSPQMSGRIKFVVYGPVVRLLLLPTPPHGDAVAVGYMLMHDCMTRTFTTPITCAPQAYGAGGPPPIRRPEQ